MRQTNKGRSDADQARRNYQLELGRQERRRSAARYGELPFDGSLHYRPPPKPQPWRGEGGEQRDELTPTPILDGTYLDLDT